MNSSKTELAPADFEKLRRLDTCTASNAVERFNVRLRNEGFMHNGPRCQFPHFPPMLGYAVTGRIRASTTPISGQCYYDRIDFWRHFLSAPEPRIMILEDVDRIPGIGAFVGEIHANIALALRCIGYVTNGAVRDLPAVEATGFQLFAGSVAVSHAYAHIVEFGEPVEIGGLKIHPGDLIHGDRHGIHNLPLAIASEIPDMALEIQKQERDLIQLCRAPDFSLDGLDAALRRQTCGLEKVHENE